ncbi:MAG: hypothetical protein OXF79_21480 [Chloroflexi bacterium]|nr:hypothetical protein [Chloroflexota bacterium]
MSAPESIETYRPSATAAAVAFFLANAVPGDGKEGNDNMIAPDIAQLPTLGATTEGRGAFFLPEPRDCPAELIANVPPGPLRSGIAMGCGPQVAST